MKLFLFLLLPFACLSQEQLSVKAYQQQIKSNKPSNVEVSMTIDSVVNIYSSIHQQYKITGYKIEEDQITASAIDEDGYRLKIVLFLKGEELDAVLVYYNRKYNWTYWVREI